MPSVPVPDVSYQTLLRLLERQAEGVDLDYKETIDLRSRRDIVEITKDIGALMDRGGHIVIGADSAGRPTQGLSATQEQDLDEARVRGIIGRYIPEPYDIYTAVHSHEGLRLAVIHVPPHPDGFCVFRADGQYESAPGKRPTAVFRNGDIYVRHGSSSERAAHHDHVRFRNKPIGGDDTPPIDDLPGWQYLLFATELERGIASHDSAWRDHQLGITRAPRTPIRTRQELASDVKARMDAFQAMIGNITKALTADHSAIVFNDPDPSGARHFAAIIVDGYADMIAWAADTRAVRTEGEAEAVYAALGEFVNLPISQIRDWVQSIGAQIRAQVEWLRDDSVEDPDRRIESVLTLSVDEAIVKQHGKAMKSLRRSRWGR